MIVLLSLLLTLPCAAAKRTPVPEASAVFKRAMAPSAAYYQGRVLLDTRVIDVRYQKPGRYRREILDSTGEVEQLVISDGLKEWIYDKRRQKVWEGAAADAQFKPLSPEQEWERLNANYEITVATADPVADRRCWRLEMRNRSDGRLRRRLWVDRRTALTLADERFDASGAVIHRMRYETLKFPGRQAKALFSFTPPAGVAVVPRLRPDHLAVEARLPRWLPSGFAFESVNVLPRGQQKIIHSRFSDGLTVISLFQFPSGVKLDAAGHRSNAEEVWAWKEARSQFVLVAPLEPQTLKQIAESLSK